MKVLCRSSVEAHETVPSGNDARLVDSGPVSPQRLVLDPSTHLLQTSADEELEVVAFQSARSFRARLAACLASKRLRFSFRDWRIETARGRVERSNQSTLRSSSSPQVSSCSDGSGK